MTMTPSIVDYSGGDGGGGGVSCRLVRSAFLHGSDFLRRTSSVGVAATTTYLSSSSSLAGDGSFYREGDRLQQPQQQQDRIPRPDEPTLFNIPSKLHATYRPMPILLQVGIVIASVLLVGKWDLSLSLGRQLYQQISVSVLRRALSFVLRTLLISTTARMVIQEALFSPSRVTTQYLAKRGELPSRLSRYRTVVPVALSSPVTIQNSCGEGEPGEEDEGGAQTTPIGVHSIQYTKKNAVASTKDNPTNHYDAIYLHHGFGASSLSWLPILPSLVESLCKSDRAGGRPAVGVAHDCPGFGFTDRPGTDEEGGLEQYGVRNNVGIGLALLKEALLSKSSSYRSDTLLGQGEIIEGDGEIAQEEEGAKLAIFGHSMGSQAALLMALRCSQNSNLQLRPRLVVLVAPALVGVSLGAPKGPSGRSSSDNQCSKKKISWIRKAARRVWIAWRKTFLDRPFSYGLRRLVGGQKFWRRGLAVAWDDPNRLSDSDVLRYQWPSIGKGWERGLVNFARSKLASQSSPASLDDAQLLKEVSELKETTVVIIYGSRDGVVRINESVVERIKNDYPSVKLARVHTGHCPFEEDADGFLLALEKVLDE